jgi:predicted dehydrogenase
VNRTRIALVGVNDRARRLLLPGLAVSPRAQVSAICSRDVEKGRAAAAALRQAVAGGPSGVGAAVDEPRVFATLDAALAAGTVDAVYLNTPLETHVALCQAALRAGCAVICEKPLAPSAKVAEALVREAEQTGVRTVVNVTYRSVPGFRLSERWLGDHGIGQPLHARFELLQGHNFFPGFVHGSALLDSGSHLFDAMAGLLEAAGFGAIEAVSASPLAEAEPDYGWAFSARTASEVAVSAQFSRSALGWRNGLRWTLSGDRAALEVELDADRTVARTVVKGDSAAQGVWRPLEVPEDIAGDDARFPAYHLDRLVGAIRGEEAFPDLAMAARTNYVAEALATSARSSAAWCTVGPEAARRPDYRG